jgi:multicomponent K+:H+ antiporter subunit G
MSIVLDIVVVALIVIGCLFMLLGAFALLRLDGFFRRIHGSSMASTLGIGCILVASIIYHFVNGSGVHPRELLITVFLFLTAPISAHVLSRAALSQMSDRPAVPERSETTRESD